MLGKKQKRSRKRRKVYKVFKFFVIERHGDSFLPTENYLNSKLAQNRSCDETIVKNKKNRLAFHRQASDKVRLQACSIMFFSMRGKTYISFKFCLFNFILWLLFIGPALKFSVNSPISPSVRFLFGGAIFVQACHPGSKEGGGNRPRPGVNLNPFQIEQFYPEMSEQTIGASGPAEGPIFKDTKRYRSELTPNFNPDIIFLDEEETNEDRMMTRRCIDRLNILALWVINQWPDVRLRVTEGWDDPEAKRTHRDNSLHYEGRAVDITTSDRDRSKYPMLARMAVEAGFDWVQLKPTYVHCSVKSESSPASISGGCFPGESMVRTPTGSLKRLDHLLPGDEVLSLDSSGKIISDKVLTFLDVQRDKLKSNTKKRLFTSLRTASGVTLRLTPNHLVYKQNRILTRTKSANAAKAFQRSTAIFAANVRPGDFLFFVDFSQTVNATMRPTEVVQTKQVLLTSGAYAPLTKRGTIVMDDVVASCYAVVGSHEVAHMAMGPLRYYHVIRSWLHSWRASPHCKACNVSHHKSIRQQREELEDGVPFYARVLFEVVARCFPHFMFQGFSSTS